MLTLSNQNTELAALHQLLTIKRTFRLAERADDGLDQTEHEQSTAAHVSQEEHDPDAATELGTQGSADHVWGAKLNKDRTPHHC